MFPLEVIGVVLLAINLVSFFLMGYDKRQSTLDSIAPRIPEGVLFCAAIMFGSAGVLLGMYVFRHKIRKWYFQVSLPILLLQQLVILNLLYPVV